jgi:hypothetical protein
MLPVYPETAMRRFGIALTLAVSFAALVALSAAGDEDPPPVKGKIGKVGKGKATKDSAVRSDLNDADALKQAGLTADEAGPLIEYLKVRTLTEGDQNKIGDVIQKFGADDFEERVKATEEVERFGPAAIGPLKTAERSSDPEVAYRARQALKRMEKVPHSQVAAAAVRTIVKLSRWPIPTR